MAKNLELKLELQGFEEVEKLLKNAVQKLDELKEAVDAIKKAELTIKTKN